MPEAPSTRLSLVGPLGSELVSDGDDIIRDLIAQLEAVGAAFLQGTSRPAAAAALEGYFYVHTGTGLVSYCTGSAWLDLQPYDSDLAAIAALSTTSYGRSLLTAGSASAMPGGEIGYDQITSPVTIVSGDESDGTPVVTCGAHTFDGGPVMAEFFAPYVTPANATSSQVTLSLFEGTTQIGRLGIVLVGEVTGENQTLGIPFVGKLRFTPSAGAHTYKVTAFATGGDANVVANAPGTGAYLPAYVRFTKV